MNENQLKITPEFIIALVIRRRWVILLPFCLVLLAGIYFAIVTPRIYEAKTLILVEGQRVPQNFVQSIVTEDTSERINTISQQILSRTNLEKVVQSFSLFTGPEYANMYMEEKVSALRESISVNVITDRRRQTDAFEISFKGRDPQKVMRVVNGLTASFIDENLKVRESQAIGTSTFLEAELETMRVRLEQLEENIKNYRKANMGELPEQLETNLRILERLQETLSNRQQNQREAKILLAEVQTQSASRQNQVVIIGPGQGGQQQTGATLEELTAELETLQSRYTARHPDIIRLKKQIAEMETREGTEPQPGDAPSTVRLSPQMRTQISELQREIQGTALEIQGIEAQISLYERRIENTPKREQELLGLKRDYQNIQTSYDSLLNRKLEADIAVNMERKQKGEQFKIVDPARLPQKPVEPNMKKIFLMVIAAGLGLGGGLAFLLEMTDKSFKKPDELESAFDLPVLATIPALISPRQVLLKRLNVVCSIGFALINVGLLGIFGLITVKGVEPLLPIVHQWIGS